MKSLTINNLKNATLKTTLQLCCISTALASLVSSATIPTEHKVNYNAKCLGSRHRAYSYYCPTSNSYEIAAKVFAEFCTKDYLLNCILTKCDKWLNFNTIPEIIEFCDFFETGTREDNYISLISFSLFDNFIKKLD